MAPLRLLQTQVKVQREEEKILELRREDENRLRLDDYHKKLDLQLLSTGKENKAATKDFFPFLSKENFFNLTPDHRLLSNPNQKPKLLDLASQPKIHRLLPVESDINLSKKILEEIEVNLHTDVVVPVANDYFAKGFLLKKDEVYKKEKIRATKRRTPEIQRPKRIWRYDKKEAEEESKRTNLDENNEKEEQESDFDSDTSETADDSPEKWKGKKRKKTHRPQQKDKFVLDLSHVEKFQINIDTDESIDEIDPDKVTIAKPEAYRHQVNADIVQEWIDRIGRLSSPINCVEPNERILLVAEPSDKSDDTVERKSDQTNTNNQSKDVSSRNNAANDDILDGTTDVEVPLNSEGQNTRLNPTFHSPVSASVNALPKMVTERSKENPSWKLPDKRAEARLSRTLENPTNMQPPSNIVAVNGSRNHFLPITEMENECETDEVEDARQTLPQLSPVCHIAKRIHLP
ncbi:unnamed protein product [Thelazia callipaeda]|uniref:PEHE domain-containing protein n=1 Tax=Thelazia callipaeda TaxID=103827 RepID=A0A0N5D6X2_THECL|nr:unnamed protein product [Thelazia callipaeda]